MLRAEPWLDYAGYAAFLGDTDLLVSLMLSPHTSYPPLEMAASGGHVVTNTFGGKSAEALRVLGPTIHAAPAALEPLVGVLTEAVAAVERADAPPAATAIPASWDVALRDVTPWLLATIAELREPRAGA
jgi:beta-1,2-rhamnosyltransferase WsaF-like protein